MKRNLIILSIIVLTAKISFSQNGQFIGLFKSGENYLKIISDSTLEFKTTYGCCLLIDIYGFGTYKITDDIIHVNTIYADNEMNSYYNVINDLNTNDRIELQINNFLTPIPYFNIALKETDSKKITNGTCSDENGVASIENIQKNQIDNLIVQISLIGYDTYEIPLTEIIGKSIEVTIKPHEIIENETVIFRITSADNMTKITGPIFPKTRESRKFNRKVKTRMIFTKWPWNWKFKDTHKPEPTEFIKQ